MIGFQKILLTATITLLLVSAYNNDCFVSGFTFGTTAAMHAKRSAFRNTLSNISINLKPNQQRRRQQQQQQHQHELTTVKGISDDWFEGIQNFLNSFNDNDASGSKSISKNKSKNKDDDDYDDDDLLADLPAGTSLILKIPVRQLKPGGLRLFLMFCLMGLQNTPSKNTWRANQPVTSPNGSRFSDTTEVVVPLSSDEQEDQQETEDYVLEMIHHDMTGTVTIELIPPREEDETRYEDADNHDDDNNNKRNFGEVRILRSGSNPSNSYLMNESVILDGILDELQQCAFDETIPVPNRLIVPVTSDAIDVAREELAFG
mmetsp:Transcript_18515/g.44673  ORF Transcript_18515/g.44673 Transcript_18515/m.44673 type:complete len:317 (+) Transcript_18515:198-1148(+)